MTVRATFQGERGAYSEDAAAALLGAGAAVELLPMPTFLDAVAAVDAGIADVAIMPVENSIAGPVRPSLAAIARFPGIQIAGEATIAIHHRLLGLPGSTPDALRVVLSHPVALAQCRAFFVRRPRLRIEEVHDTAGAARLVAERGDRARAAIASRAAGERYGLVVIAADVADSADNRTRFVALRRSKGR